MVLLSGILTYFPPMQTHRHPHQFANCFFHPLLAFALFIFKHYAITQIAKAKPFGKRRRPARQRTSSEVEFLAPESRSGRRAISKARVEFPL